MSLPHHRPRTPPKPSGNVVLIDLLFSLKESIRNTPRPVATAGATQSTRPLCPGYAKQTWVTMVQFEHVYAVCLCVVCACASSMRTPLCKYKLFCAALLHLAF